MLQDEPYEMFAFEDHGILSKQAKTGKLVKGGRGKYHIETDYGSLHNISLPEFSWVTRLISTSLRHGVPIDFLVEQLNKEGTVADVNKVLARVLKKYIKDGKVRSSAACLKCSSTNVSWQEGCMKCLDCGDSKCG
jgi:ribonucleoside-diphosphate reductase alpha chain